MCNSCKERLKAIGYELDHEISDHWRAFLAETSSLLDTVEPDIQTAAQHLHDMLSDLLEHAERR